MMIHGMSPTVPIMQFLDKAKKFSLQNLAFVISCCMRSMSKLVMCALAKLHAEMKRP